MQHAGCHLLAAAAGQLHTYSCGLLVCVKLARTTSLVHCCMLLSAYPTTVTLTLDPDDAEVCV